MDKKTLEKKLPALVLVNSEGFLFQEEKLSTVNYRVHDDTYIVDGIIEHGRLILGSDSDKKASILLQEAKVWKDKTID